MTGMSRSTGQAIGDLEHLRQSIADILTTPLGTRLMRRDYGSLIPELIDQPLNGATVTRLYAATATALIRWEPRLRLSRVQLSLGSAPGSAFLDLEGNRVDDNASFSLRVPLTMGASA
ncbi:GPW/gp25 family protein [Azotobacter salinestris]|uniref:GPW/gp25 family protein n=1 Tax=Azotobacter salinestris TaxID=69964 RepID=UPI0032DF0120